MTEENVIQVRQGQHPLQSLTVPVFVSNDSNIKGGAGDSGEAHGKPPGVFVLTGPNHSGKSVYLKQVALIVYLAHVGSYVPAAEAVVGITDQISTRITTRESVSGAESAFGIDLRQTSFLLRTATRRSLILIDEFGKGTKADDGAGLMAALLDHIQKLGSHMPRTLVATHFHEVFECDILTETIKDMSFAHMAVETGQKAREAGEQVAYLFQLKAGRCTSSFGIQCAALNGVADEVIARAEAVALLLARNEDIGAACARLSRDEETRLEEAETVARSFLQKKTVQITAAGQSGVGEASPLRALLGQVLDAGRGAGRTNASA